MTWCPTRVDPNAAKPLHVQVRQAIVEAIHSGALRPGDRLPGIRWMADTFGVHRLTALKAAGALAHRGVLTAVKNKGFFVSATGTLLGKAETKSPGPFFEGIAEGPAADDVRHAGAALGRFVEDSFNQVQISFAAGFPPEDQIPAGHLRPLAARAMAATNRSFGLGYAPPEGHGELIKEIRRLLEQRGLVLDTDDRILITSGAQQAIALTLECFFQGHRGLAIESPGYMGTIAACRQKGIYMVPVPVDSGGVHLQSLEKAFASGDTGGLYTVPTYQNPTGVTQQKKRREKILAIARAHDAILIEDDIYADLRFGGRPIIPIKGLLGKERVIYIGSFSKSIAPGLRIGFVVASGEHAQRLLHLKETNDIGTSMLLQTILASFLEGGGYHRHLMRVRRAYKARRNAMIRALDRYLGTSVTFTRPKGGMHLWVMPHKAVNMKRLAARALERGVRFAEGSLFFTDHRQASSFRLNFATNTEARIAEGVKRLADCMIEEMEQ